MEADVWKVPRTFRMRRLIQDLRDVAVVSLPLEVRGAGCVFTLFVTLFWALLPAKPVSRWGTLPAYVMLYKLNTQEQL